MTGGAYVASTIFWAEVHFVCGDPVQHVPHLHPVGKNDTERQCCGFASCPHGPSPSGDDHPYSPTFPGGLCDCGEGHDSPPRTGGLVPLTDPGTLPMEPHQTTARADPEES